MKYIWCLLRMLVVSSQLAFGAINQNDNEEIIPAASRTLNEKHAWMIFKNLTPARFIASTNRNLRVLERLVNTAEDADEIVKDFVERMESTFKAYMDIVQTEEGRIIIAQVVGNATMQERKEMYDVIRAFEEFIHTHNIPLLPYRKAYFETWYQAIAAGIQGK